MAHDRAPTPADAATHRPAATRRTPFSDNPTVGARGLRTQQRILDGALQAFGEGGYTGTTIGKIACAAGCSRVAVYQYFVDKDDVFRHLAGQLARQLSASLEAMGAITADAAGWTATRAWVARRGDIHLRYEPVFRAFSAAAVGDPALVRGSVRASEQSTALFEAKVIASPLPQRQLDAVVDLLLAMLARVFDIGAILRSELPNEYPRDRIEDAVTDVIHRSLFGRLPGINAKPQQRAQAPRISLGTTLPAVFEQVAALEREASGPGRKALASLLEVGQDVVVTRGFQGTRVDDLVEVAGVSHGAFYRYFENKHQFVRVLAAQALLVLSTALAEMPALSEIDPGDRRPALRAWLHRFQELNGQHAAVIRVWTEGARQDDDFQTDSASAFDWGRRQLHRWLSGSPAGDVDCDAVVMLAAVEAFGGRATDSAELEAIVHILESSISMSDERP